MRMAGDERFVETISFLKDSWKEVFHKIAFKLPTIVLIWFL